METTEVAVPMQPHVFGRKKNVNIWRKGIPALVLLGAVFGCVPIQSGQRMERDLEEMKRRLAAVEQSAVEQRQNRTGEFEGRLDVLARNHADLQAGLDALRVELQSVNGRFEDMAQKRMQLREEVSLVQEDLGLKLAVLEERLVKLEGKVPGQVMAPPEAETPKVLYERSLELVQKKSEFARGREMLQEFLRRYPRNDLAVNAMYWIGEAYYGEKKYENAILQFQDVIQKYGDHPKAAAALLKQGLAFYALSDVKNARVILQKVVGSYPKSQEAAKARKRLAKWKQVGT
jgi:tol-pal system protein YbgF